MTTTLTPETITPEAITLAQPRTRTYVDPHACLQAGALEPRDVIHVNDGGRGRWLEVLETFYTVDPLSAWHGETSAALINAGAECEYKPRKGADGVVICTSDDDRPRNLDYAHMGARLATGEYVAVRVLRPHACDPSDSAAWGWVIFTKTEPVHVLRPYSVSVPVGK